MLKVEHFVSVSEPESFGRFAAGKVSLRRQYEGGGLYSFGSGV